MSKKQRIDFDNLKRLKVLCVEDQEFILQQLALILSTKVKEVYTAENGLEALKIFKANSPDIVITDIEMPELNGLELTKQIKNINPSTPVIITTAYNDTTHLLGAFDVGADNFVTKPVDVNKLFLLLSKYGGLLKQKNELIAMQKRMENIANSMGEGLFVINTKGDLQYSNFAAINFTGLDMSSGKRINLKDIVDNCENDSDFSIYDNLFEKTIVNLESYISDNVVFKTEFGKNINVTLVSTPLIENDVVKGAVLIFRDITDEIKKNLKLQMLVKAVESSSVSILLLDLNGKITEANKGFFSLAKIERLEVVINKHYTDFLSSIDFEINPFETAAFVGYWQGEMVLSQSNKKVCPVEAIFSLLLGDEGVPVQMLISLFDITERKRAAQAVLKAKSQELELYKYRERYHSLQQEYAFKKQAKIIQDDLSNKRVGNYFIETYFKPLDVLSGDIYGSIDGGNGRYLFYIIDAMGKGLSASVTSTQSSSFINHAFGTAFIKDDFSFKGTVSSYITYIKKQLLDDELLCVLFLFIDPETQSMEIANYGMPPLLYQNTSKEVIQVASNNPPVMKFFNSNNTDIIGYENINKLMIYSDGLDEHVTKDGVLYIEELKEDFKHSIAKKDFFDTFNKKITELTDDITTIFLFKVDSEPISTFECEIENSSEVLDKEVDNILKYLHSQKVPFRKVANLALCLNELIMNAIEHGNLGISFSRKQFLVEQGGYELHLQKLSTEEKNINKKIRVGVKRYFDEIAGHYTLIRITDEGEGFDSSQVFKNLNFSDDMIRYHGRGIAMSQLMTDGIFYNKNGNSVTILIIEK